VLNKPVIIMPKDTTFCEAANEKKFVGRPSGGTWSGLGITSDGVFTPSGLTSDAYYKLTYAFDLTSCATSGTMYAYIVKRPSTPNIVGAKTEYCTGDSINVYATVPSTSGLKFNWYKNDETTSFSTKTNLAMVATKDLRKLLVESENTKGCSSLSRAETSFLIDEVRVTPILDKYSLSKGGRVTFDVSVQNDAVKSVVWDFGDKTFGVGESVVHFYHDTGHVEVKCKVTTDKGCNITKYADSLVFIKGDSIKVETSADAPFGDTRAVDNYLQIFPNPSTGIFNIYVFLPEGLTEIGIKDMFGRDVLKKQVIGLTNMSLDLSGFDAGMYLLQLSNEAMGSERNRVYKIVKK